MISIGDWQWIAPYVALILLALLSYLISLFDAKFGGVLWMGYARSQSNVNKEEGNHPSPAGLQKAAEEFVELLNYH